MKDKEFIKAQRYYEYACERKIENLDREYENLSVKEKLENEDLKTIISYLTDDLIKQQFNSILNEISIDKINRGFIIDILLDLIFYLPEKKINAFRNYLIDLIESEDLYKEDI